MRGGRRDRDKWLGVSPSTLSLRQPRKELAHRPKKNTHRYLITGRVYSSFLSHLLRAFKLRADLELKDAVS